MFIEKEWIDFKTLADDKCLKMQYETRLHKYYIYMVEGIMTYECFIRISSPASSDQEDFENNYKSDCNKPINPVDDEGRQFLRAESKPVGMTTYFTTRGDTETAIGDGDKLEFDFNNTDNDITTPPTGFKQKRVCCTFIDTVRLKEGTLYWENMPFGSHIDLCLGVPDQAYYQKNDGSYAQNTTGEDLMIAKFVNNSPMMGNCPMGDEMNTEAASNDIPPGTIFGFLVTVPDTVTNTDNVHGAVVLELYRKRTVIL